MDCRTCQPSLLDFAYGELAPELAQVVRAHVNGCDSCGAAFRALQQGIAGSEQLAWLEPPPAMSTNIMAYAEQHARERAQAAVAAKAAAKPRGGFVQSVLDFIGRMASGRQFAMATVFALVVTVGVWVIPELQPLPEGQGVTVVSPDPEGEAAPSGGLAPAEPLDLTVDQRSRRIRSREELEVAAQLAKNNVQDAPEPMAEQAFEAPSKQEAALETSQVAAAEKEALPNPYELERRDESAGDAPAEAKVAANATRPAGRSKSADKEAFPASAEDPLMALNDGERARSAKPARPAAPAQAPVPATSALQAPDDLLDGALGSSAGAKAKGAVSALERARSARNSQGCAAALPAYEQAVQEYSRSSPQSSVLGTALIELAECQYQLGRESLARATLKRAAEVAPVAVRARALLDKADVQAVEAEAAPAAASPSPSKD
jgi:hypothetical protein